ncbi:MAG: proline racemase family protein [Actinobacteria bacterium]|nr:proline racemase family protein [Actinomycetota bacterium]
MKFSKSIFTIDSHTMGEPTRVVTAGIPFIPGNSMMEKKIYLKEKLDYIRKLLMLEPRGHNGMFGSVLTQPVNPSADLGVIFMDTEGYLNMCGHGSIGTVTVVLEMGLISMKEPITEVVLDTPAGLVKAQAKISQGRVEEVTFQGVPSFVFKVDHKVLLPEVGEINVDIAFGGNFFGIVSAKDLGIKVERKNISRLIYLSIRLREELNKSIKVTHPENRYINSIDLIEIYDSPTDSEADLKNCVIFGKGQIDRSPCGAGTCAKLAVLYNKGKIRINEEFVYESILGTKFKGRIDTETKVGDFPAIIPKITGSAYITGLQQFVVDENDPLKYGFTLMEDF